MIDWLNLTVGVVIGFASSFGFWWLMTKYIRPKMEFSNNIVARTGLSGKKIITIKMRNCGRRNAHAISVYCRLVVRFTKSNGKWTEDTYSIRSSKAHDGMDYAIIRSGSNRLINFYFLNSPDILESVRLKEILEGSKGCNEEFIKNVFEKFERSYICMYILAHDSWSMSPHFCESDKLRDFDDKLMFSRRVGLVARGAQWLYRKSGFDRLTRGFPA